MALVVVARPVVGAVTAITDVNDTFTSWNAASADVDAINFRDEAFDRRVVVVRAVTPADGRAKSSNFAGVGPPLLVDPLWTTIITLGPINSAAAGDMVIIRANFDYLVPARAIPPATPTGDIITFRLESNIGAGYVVVPRTTREFRMHQNAGTATQVGERGSHTIVHRGTIANAAVQYRLVANQNVAAATASVPRSSMIGKVFAK